MGVIETVNLGHSYNGKTILKNVELNIPRGDVLALIGPTGAGKTMLLRLLDLLEEPSSGTIYFDGVNVTRFRNYRLEARRRMAFVQQKPIVFTMSVYDNVACGLRLRHEKGETIKRKVDDALELVGMTEYRDRNARLLSGGETQRIAIARALVTAPEVLFLDEPTANLDPVSTSKVEELLAHIIQERKTTVVMTTHDMSQGQRLAGRMGVLIKGELQQVGNTEEIFCSPQSREVAEFVGIENILNGVIIEKDENLATVRIDGSAIQAVSDCGVGDKVHVLLRPEDITLSRAKEKSSARNVFQGRITRVAPVGALVRIEVDCGFPLLGVVTRRSAEELELTIGNSVYASFKATALHIIRRWN